MSFKLDKLDLNLLMHLQNNARMSTQEISRKIHLSANAVSARIKRLEDDGYIEKYITVLSKVKFNRNLECLTGVRLEYNNHSSLKDFLECIRKVPQVYHCYHVNHIFDFILHIVATDVKDYHECLTDMMSKIKCSGRITPFIIFSQIEGTSIVDLTLLTKRLNNGSKK